MLSVSKNGEKTREYVYNKINNLMSSTVDGVTTTYAYNGDRLRESKTTNGVTTRHIYDGTDVVADVTGDTTTNFVRGIGLIYSENMATGDKRKYALNAHGDVAKRINADGTAEKFNYRAYGIGIVGTPDPFGYCGEYTDSETGLIYLRNRYYDPELGRFINVDPIFSGANWYAYCSGNPIRYSDPFGTEQIVISGGRYSYNEKGNFKYNFIEPAIKKLIELKKGNQTSENITWVIADVGWTEGDKNKFEKVAKDIGIGLQYISNKDELIGYINNKYSGTDDIRSKDLITKVAVFAHGVPGKLMLGFDYQDEHSEFSIGLSDLTTDTIKTFDAFSNPNTMFYSCNSGTDVGGTWGNNFAQKWVNITGGKAWGFVGKSDYSKMSLNEKFAYKVSRNLHGFSFYGSANYPEPSSNAYINSFWR